MGLATFDGLGGPLILDEPTITRFPDIDSRDELIEAINDYEGACILVSHDRRLLEACVDRLWLVASGTVRPFRRRHRRLWPHGAQRKRARACPQARDAGSEGGGAEPQGETRSRSSGSWRRSRKV